MTVEARESIDGPELCAWLVERCPAILGDKVRTLGGDSNVRRFNEWEKGGSPQADTVEKILLHMDIGMWELPESLLPSVPGGEKTHAYCDACREEVPVGEEDECLWCLGPTRDEYRKRKPAKKSDRRRRPKGRISHEQLRLLHRIHIEKGRSINSLAEELWEQFGYASKRSCASAIGRGFKQLGLKARDRIEATVAASTKHGMAPKHGPRPGYGFYKRRVLHGIPDQPGCAGTLTQGAVRGERCSRPAMHGSEFCSSHDPTLAAQREAHLREVRIRWARSEKVPAEPLVRWIRDRYEELGSWADVGYLISRHASLAHAYGRGVKTDKQTPLVELQRRTVERLLEDVEGVDFTDLYPELVAA